MKPTVNKSELFKRAWKIFKGDNPYSYSFSASLRRAWEVEKANIEYAVRCAEEAARAAEIAKARQNRTEVSNEITPEFAAAMINYYSGEGSQGRYFGD